MSVNIHININGETAAEADKELRALAERLAGKVEYSLDTPTATTPAGSLTASEAAAAADNDDEDSPEKPAGKKAKKKGKKKTAKPTPPPEPPDETESETPEKGEDDTPTIDDVKSAVRGFLSAFDDNAAAQKAAKDLLLDKFDVGQVSKLEEEQYADAIEVFEKATAERTDESDDE